MVIEKGKHVGTLEKDSIVNVVANSSVEKQLNDINVKMVKEMVKIDKQLPISIKLKKFKN